MEFFFNIVFSDPIKLLKSEKFSEMCVLENSIFWNMSYFLEFYKNS